MYSNEVICDILNYIDKNINKKISIEELSHHFFINRYYLMRLFKKKIGISIVEYINSIRINDSLNDIKTNSILNVALTHGFYSQEYYSEIFKKIIGVSPIIYKKFLNYNKKISIKDSDTILNAVIYLKELINIKDKYLSNRKPKENLTRFPSIFNRSHL